jgi:hypothetical protein
MDRLTKKFHFKEEKKKAWEFRNREDELNKIKDDYVKLDVPIHIGFIKYYVINPLCIERLKNIGHLDVVKNILEKINTTIFSKSRSFLIKHGVKGKKKKFRKEPLKLKHISVGAYQLLTENEKWYFTLNTIYNRYNKSLYNVYVFNRMELLQEKIAPYFITHKKVVDTNLESEKTYVSDKLWGRDNYYNRLAYSRKSYNHYDKYGDIPRELKAYYTEKEFLNEIHYS